MTPFRPLILACALAIAVAPFAANADPDKDKSGNSGKYEDNGKDQGKGNDEWKDKDKDKDKDKHKDDRNDKDEGKDGYESRYRDDFDGRDWDSHDDWVRDPSRRDRTSPYFRDRYSRLDIPYGHYPPPGECRVWYPGRPPGQQPPSGSCRSLGDVPRGAWLIRRPRDASKKDVYINARGNPAGDAFDVIGIFDPRTGRLVREIEGR